MAVQKPMELAERSLLEHALLDALYSIRGMDRQTIWYTSRISHMMHDVGSMAQMLGELKISLNATKAMVKKMRQQLRCCELLKLAMPTMEDGELFAEYVGQVHYVVPASVYAVDEMADQYQAMEKAYRKFQAMKTAREGGTDGSAKESGEAEAGSGEHQRIVESVEDSGTKPEERRPRRLLGG